jgi:hypothetical protein
MARMWELVREDRGPLVAGAVPHCRATHGTLSRARHFLVAARKTLKLEWINRR